MRRIRLPLTSLVLALAVTAPAVAQVNVPLPRQPAAGQPQPGPASDPTPVPMPAPMPAAPAPGTAVPLPGTPPTVVTPRPDINPYDRDIDMTAPMLYRDRPLGEVTMLLTRDDRFVIETAGFLKLIDPLLNDAAKAKLSTALAGLAMFESKDLAETGISLEYDPGALAIVVLRIDSSERATEELFPTPRYNEEPPDAAPEHFSAYLNVNAVTSYIWGNSAQKGLNKPAFYFDGAVRLGNFVLEGDFQLAQQMDFTSRSYQFDRNYVRLVYDQPSEFRRWYLGDLQMETRARQSYVRMGGLGVSRQRIRFDPFRPAILRGDRQLVLQHDATVDVYRNGSLLKQFQLQAGAYDLSSLPLTAGSNDLEVRVRDVTGAIQTLAYRSYLDPIDLMPGDYEYAAYIGKTSRQFGRSPSYDGRIAFSGFFRKAFIDAPAIGIGLQVSEVTQVLTGQIQFLFGRGSRLGLDAGISHTKGYGVGYAPGITFEQIFDRAGLLDSFTLRAEYTSRNFGNLGTDDPNNSTQLSVDAQYARAINRALTLQIGGTYSKNRDQFGDTYRVNATATYRISPKWSVRGGVDYAKYGNVLSSRNGFGFNLSLIWTPNFRDRAEALYQHADREAQVSYTHMSDGRIGSIGYGALVMRNNGQATASAYGDYVGPFFDVSLNHAAFGNGFDSITNQQVTSLRVGTSLAFAGGEFAVGRRIVDSFAILHPHESLKGHSVVAGQSIAENLYLSKSGALGGAVNGYLSSYIPQTVQYDVEDPPPGYDVGSGVFRVNPSYRSGYALQIGTDAFASATGTLMGPDGKPLSLVGGQVLALDGRDARPVPFFTNSVGRFAVQNLRPGMTYRVELYNAAGGFDITVPKDTSGLVDLQTITARTGR